MSTEEQITNQGQDRAQVEAHMPYLRRIFQAIKEISAGNPQRKRLLQEYSRLKQNLLTNHRDAMSEQQLKEIGRMNLEILQHNNISQLYADLGAPPIDHFEENIPANQIWIDRENGDGAETEKPKLGRYQINLSSLLITLAALAIQGPNSPAYFLLKTNFARYVLGKIPGIDPEQIRRLDNQSNSINQVMMTLDKPTLNQLFANLILNLDQLKNTLAHLPKETLKSLLLGERINDKGAKLDRTIIERIRVLNFLPSLLTQKGIELTYS